MIVTDFLPKDDALYTVTNPVELTESIEDLALSYPDGWPGAYWMGWVSWDTVPEMILVSNALVSVDVNGRNVIVTCTKTTPQNLNVGYLAEGYQANAVTKYFPIDSKCFTDNNGVYYDSRSNVSPYMGSRFINKLDPRGVAIDLANYNTECTLGVILTVKNNSPISYGTVPIYITFSNADDLQKFLKGEITKTISGSGYTKYDNDSNYIYFSYNYTLDINSPDYGAITPNVWSFTQDGKEMHAFLCGYQVGQAHDYLTQNAQYQYGTLGIVPAFSQSYNDDIFYSSGVSSIINYFKFNCDLNTGVTSPVEYDSAFWFLNSHSCPVADLTNQLFIGGYDCNINIGYGDFYTRYTAFSGNCAIMCYKLQSIYILRVLSPDEMLKSMAFNMRAIIDGDNVYGFGNTVLVPHISPDNEYLCEWLTGAFDTIKDDLRPWQYGDITDNQYTPEDLPPYYPPAEKGENVGDKITRPATLGAGGTLGFITQYALRAADVTELGGLLWTSIFTSDYWKNYMFSLALDTGSLDLASILNFFISLRVYPFPLVNVPSYAQFGQDMYIGSGIMPLHFANNLHTINNYCDYVPGGSAVVDSGNFYHDWRDYINTEIILYIPYCGTVQLNPGDVVGNTVSVQYAVDFATGGCIAYVDLETGDGAGYPIAALPGQMGADIPLTATAAGQVAARLAGDAMNIAGLIGRGESDFIGGSVGAFGAAATGNIGGTVNALASLAGAPADMYGGLARQAVNMLSRGAVSAPMLGGARGFASFGAPQTPYIQIRRGIYPDFGADIMGNATAGVYTVGDLSGFVSGEIKTDSLTCNDYEKSQIKQLISHGIYV